jgi:hypothetical protein
LERKSRGLQERSIEIYREKLKHFTKWTDKQSITNIDEVTPCAGYLLHPPDFREFLTEVSPVIQGNSFNLICLTNPNG